MSIKKEQKKIVKKLGISVLTTDSFNVVAAKILDYVAIATGDWEAAAPTDRQIEYAKSLGLRIDGSSRRVVSAKIEDELTKRNIRALTKLKLKPGDKVKLKDENSVRDNIVSSIKENGKIYFKGIGCRQAWATQIESKVNEES